MRVLVDSIECVHDASLRVAGPRNQYLNERRSARPARTAASRDFSTLPKLAPQPPKRCPSRQHGTVVLFCDDGQLSPAQNCDNGNAAGGRGGADGYCCPYDGDGHTDSDTITDGRAVAAADASADARAVGRTIAAANASADASTVGRAVAAADARPDHDCSADIRANIKADARGDACADDDCRADVRADASAEYASADARAVSKTDERDGVNTAADAQPDAGAV